MNGIFIVIVCTVACGCFQGTCTLTIVVSSSSWGFHGMPGCVALALCLYFTSLSFQSHFKVVNFNDSFCVLVSLEDLLWEVEITRIG